MYTAVMNFIEANLMYVSIGVVVIVALLSVFFTKIKPKLSFLYRRKKLGKKMTKYSMRSIEELTNQLFDTKSDHWSVSSENIVFYPFPTKKKTRFIFNEFEQKLSLFEHKHSFVSLAFDHEKSLYLLQNDVDDSMDADMNQLKFKNLFSHLTTITLERTARKLSTKETEALAFQNWLQEKEILLRHALSSPHFWNNKSIDEFHIKYSEHQEYRLASLLFQGNELFSAHSQDTQYFSQVKNEDSAYFSLVKNLSSELETYFQRGLTGQLSEKQLDSKSLSNVDLKELEGNAMALLNAISKEAQWLSDKNKEKATTTYPREIQSMLSIYAQASDPSSVEEHMASTFKDIIRSLKMMEYEVKNNKQRASLTQQVPAKSED